MDQKLLWTKIKLRRNIFRICSFIYLFIFLLDFQLILNFWKSRFEDLKKYFLYLCTKFKAAGLFVWVWHAHRQVHKISSLFYNIKLCLFDKMKTYKKIRKSKSQVHTFRCHLHAKFHSSTWHSCMIVQ